MIYSVELENNEFAHYHNMFGLVTVIDIHCAALYDKKGLIDFMDKFADQEKVFADDVQLKIKKVHCLEVKKVLDVNEIIK